MSAVGDDIKAAGSTESTGPASTSHPGPGHPRRRSAPPPPVMDSGAAGTSSLKRPLRKSPSHSLGQKSELQQPEGSRQQHNYEQLQVKFFTLEKNYGNLKQLTKKG